jgi:hypothetical protein
MVVRGGIDGKNLAIVHYIDIFDIMALIEAVSAGDESKDYIKTVFVEVIYLKCYGNGLNTSFLRLPQNVQPHEHARHYLTAATTITTTGSVAAASSVPSATAPDTGLTSR